MLCLQSCRGAIWEAKVVFKVKYRYLVPSALAHAKRGHQLKLLGFDSRTQPTVGLGNNELDNKNSEGSDFNT